MYFIVLFSLSWLAFILFANKKRLREIYGVMIFSCFLALITDLIMIHYKLWSYEGLPHASFSIPLLLDLSIYPVVSFIFIQHLPTIWKRKSLYILVWTLFSLILEYVTLRTGHIIHHKWWNLGLSGVSDIIIYVSFILLYNYYSSAYTTSERKTPSPIK